MSKWKQEPLIFHSTSVYLLLVYRKTSDLSVRPWKAARSTCMRIRVGFTFIRRVFNYTLGLYVYLEQDCKNTK